MRLGDALIVLGDGLEKTSSRQFQREQETAETARQENMARFQHQQQLARDEANFGREKELIGIRQKGDVELEGLRAKTTLDREKHADARAASRDRVMADRNDATTTRQTTNIVLTDLQKRREQAEDGLRALEANAQRIQAASAKKDILGNEMDPSTGLTWAEAYKLNQQQIEARRSEIQKINTAFDFEYQRSQGAGRDAPPVRAGSGQPQRGHAKRKPTLIDPATAASIPASIRR